MPGHGAQIRARTPTKGYVQTSARARATATGTKSERGLRKLLLGLTDTYESKRAVREIFNPTFTELFFSHKFNTNKVNLRARFNAYALLSF